MPQREEEESGQGRLPEGQLAGKIGEAGHSRQREQHLQRHMYWKQHHELRNYISLSVTREGLHIGEWQETKLGRDRFAKHLRFQLQLSSLLQVRRKGDLEQGNDSWATEEGQIQKLLGW